MERSSENSCLGDLPRLKFPRHTRQGGKKKQKKKRLPVPRRAEGGKHAGIQRADVAAGRPDLRFWLVRENVSTKEELKSGNPAALSSAASAGWLAAADVRLRGGAEKTKPAQRMKPPGSPLSPFLLLKIKKKMHCLNSFEIHEGLDKTERVGEKCFGAEVKRRD